MIRRHEEHTFTDKSIPGAGGSAWSLLGFCSKKNSPSIEDGKKCVERKNIFCIRTVRSENPQASIVENSLLILYS